MRRLVALLSSVVLGIGALTGCGEQEQGSDQAKGSEDNSGSGETRPQLPRHDPPRKFEPASAPMPLPYETEGQGEQDDGSESDAAGSDSLEDQRFVGWDRFIGRVDRRGLELFDSQASRRPSTITPDTTQGSSGGSGPEVETPDSGYAVHAKLDGKDLFLVAYSQIAKGTGTTKDHPQLRLQAIDPEAGKVVWTVDTDLTGYDEEDIGAIRPEQIVVDEKTGMVAVGTVNAGDNVLQSEVGVTAVIDAGEQKPLWWREDAMLASLMDGVVAVAENDDDGDAKLVGRDVRSQQEKWSHPYHARTVPIGGTTEVALLAEPAGEYSFDSKLHAVDASGKATPAYSPTGADVKAETWVCHDDQKSAIVCVTDSQIVGLDRSSGTKRWAYTEDERVVPEVTTAYHGLIYGDTDNGPVMVDARTGKDDSTKATIAPRVVTPYVAAMTDQKEVDEGFGVTEKQDRVTYFKTAG